jgi:hypothetical protein
VRGAKKTKFSPSFQDLHRHQVSHPKTDGQTNDNVSEARPTHIVGNDLYVTNPSIAGQDTLESTSTLLGQLNLYGFQASQNEHQCQIKIVAPDTKKNNSIAETSSVVVSALVGVAHLSFGDHLSTQVLQVNSQANDQTIIDKGTDVYPDRKKIQTGHLESDPNRQVDTPFNEQTTKVDQLLSPQPMKAGIDLLFLTTRPARQLGDGGEALAAQEPQHVYVSWGETHAHLAGLHGN